MLEKLATFQPVATNWRPFQGAQEFGCDALLSLRDRLEMSTLGSAALTPDNYSLAMPSFRSHVVNVQTEDVAKPVNSKQADGGHGERLEFVNTVVRTRAMVQGYILAN